MNASSLTSGETDLPTARRYASLSNTPAVAAHMPPNASGRSFASSHALSSIAAPTGTAPSLSRNAVPHQTRHCGVSAVIAAGTAATKYTGSLRSLPSSFAQSASLSPPYAAISLTSSSIFGHGMRLCSPHATSNLGLIPALRILRMYSDAFSAPAATTATAEPAGKSSAISVIPSPSLIWVIHIHMGITRTRQRNTATFGDNAVNLSLRASITSEAISFGRKLHHIYKFRHVLRRAYRNA